MLHSTYCLNVIFLAAVTLLEFFCFCFLSKLYTDLARSSGFLIIRKGKESKPHLCISLRFTQWADTAFRGRFSRTISLNFSGFLQSCLGDARTRRNSSPKFSCRLESIEDPAFLKIWACTNIRFSISSNNVITAPDL